jgi:hypothetical protein
VALRRFDVWRRGLAAVAGAALAALVAWAATSLAAAPAGAEAPILGTAIGLGIGAVVIALSLGRVEAGVLACRHGSWTFAPDRSPQAPVAGELAVALDLGSFLLLTLAGSGQRRRRWLPVQRLGLEHDWHALRCAVYSPPLAAAEIVPTNESPP